MRLHSLVGPFLGIKIRFVALCLMAIFLLVGSGVRASIGMGDFSLFRLKGFENIPDVIIQGSFVQDHVVIAYIAKQISKFLPISSENWASHGAYVQVEILTQSASTSQVACSVSTSVVQLVKLIRSPTPPHLLGKTWEASDVFVCKRTRVEEGIEKVVLSHLQRLAASYKMANQYLPKVPSPTASPVPHQPLRESKSSPERLDRVSVLEATIAFCFHSDEARKHKPWLCFISSKAGGSNTVLIQKLRQMNVQVVDESWDAPHGPSEPMQSYRHIRIDELTWLTKRRVRVNLGCSQAWPVHGFPAESSDEVRTLYLDFVDNRWTVDHSQLEHWDADDKSIPRSSVTLG